MNLSPNDILSSASKYLKSEKYQNYKIDEKIEGDIESNNDLIHIIYENEEFR
jgi:hypothetical protein